MTTPIPLNYRASYVLTFSDKDGQPATVDGAPVATSSDPAIVTVYPAPDGLSGHVDVIGEGAAILAPCPHAQACPLVEPDWCHFVQRLPRSRDHRLLFDEPARLAAVTLDQANRTAASVLRRINRTVGLIRPSAAATKD